MEKGGAMMEIDEARRVIRSQVAVRPAIAMPLDEACGRVTAGPVLATADSPAFNQSAMDGFAIASGSAGPHPLLEADQIPSSGKTEQPLGAVRVATGHPVPAWAHCVVPQEQACVEDGFLRVAPGTILDAGFHIRRRGGSFRTGTEVIPAGQVLTPGAVALTALCGYDEIVVRQPFEALHIATGSELVPAPATLKAGQVYDCNGPMMAALLGSQGISCRRIMTGDNASKLRLALTEFSGALILISGGSGPGEQDHSARALIESGFHIHIFGVRSRPGKPLIFATRGDQVAFGLPGNPLSQWVCFHVFVRTALDRWNGLPPAERIMADCSAWESVPGDGRPSWTPATLSYRDGRVRLHPIAWKHSGDLLPITCATALAFGSPDAETGRISALLL